MKRLAKGGYRDRIPGGRAAGRRPSNFDRFALARGTAVELEHTSDPRVAQEIAMDHLMEDPQYYEKLARMEAGACDPGRSEEYSRGVEEGALPEDEDEDEVVENPADVDIVFTDSEAPDDTPLIEDAWALMHASPIATQSVTDVLAVAVRDYEVVGAVFAGVTFAGLVGEGALYQFDIVVAPALDPARRHGVFKRLVVAAESNFEDLRDAYPDLKYEVHVVHPYAKKVLDRAGFVVTKELPKGWGLDGNHAWMMTKENPAPLGPQRLLTPAEKRRYFPGVRADAEVFVGQPHFAGVEPRAWAPARSNPFYLRYSEDGAPEEELGPMSSLDMKFEDVQVEQTADFIVDVSDYTWKQVGELLKEAREAQELTQAQVAKRAGISTRHYRNLEHGYEASKEFTLKAVSGALGFRVDGRPSDVPPATARHRARYEERKRAAKLGREQ